MSDARTDRGFEYRTIAHNSSSLRLLKLFDEGEAWECEGLLPLESELLAIQERCNPQAMYQALDIIMLLTEVRRELVLRYRLAMGSVGVSRPPDPVVDRIVEGL